MKTITKSLTKVKNIAQTNLSSKIAVGISLKNNKLKFTIIGSNFDEGIVDLTADEIDNLCVLKDTLLSTYL